jgi:phosphoribosylamine---glycine ligase
MRILIIGGGGREHAIAWRLAQSGHEIFAAPGNPGIAELGQTLSATNYLATAQELRVDLTVVGPETPLVAGIVDEFRAARQPIIGPTKVNARLEGSKIFAKRFMQDAGIPTARAEHVTTIEEARTVLKRFPLPVVIKADGLMAGKGVIVAGTQQEAELAVTSLGPSLVIEEFLEGEEVSFIVLADGRDVVAFEATQDHKAVFDGDRGPNTGGMGAYCDGRILNNNAAREILRTVIEPVIERTGFTGFLYAGLMMTSAGFRVLEFNVRLGDPETQPLMHRLNCDFGEVLNAAAHGELRRTQLRWRPEPSVCVVLAAQGYPGEPRKGDLIIGIENAGTEVFHAGTRIGSRGLETAGGRVLGVTARGPDLKGAIDTAYNATSRINFEGMHYRKDIGIKGLKRW